MRSKGKYGLRSGNTFHFGSNISSTTLRHSRDQHVIIKTIDDDSLTDIHSRRFAFREPDNGPRDNCIQRLIARASQLVSDGGLPFDDDWRAPEEPRLNVGGHVSLTLNKRRRWLLPAMIDDAIDQLREEDLEFRDDDAADSRARLPPIRITRSIRLIAPKFNSGDPFRGCSALAADCVSCSDSLPTAKRRVVPRRHKSSFYTDLREAAGGYPERLKYQRAARPTSRRFPRTHTRGIQRLNNAKRKRSGNNSEHPIDGTLPVAEFIRLLHERYEEEVRLNMEAGLDIAALPPPIPEIHYEICHPKPLMAHRFNCDYRHRDRFRFCSNARKSLKKVSGGDRYVRLANESSNELASFVRFAERDCRSASEVCQDDTILSYEFCPSSETRGLPVAVDSENDDDVSGLIEGRRDLPLTVQLADAVKCRSRQTKRGKRRNSEMASDDDRTIGTSTVTKISSLTVNRRGKGAAIYIDSASSTSQIAETGSDDVADFIVVDSPPSRRAKWMDTDFETTEQRAFTCSLSRAALGSLSECFGRRLTEGRSLPRRYLVDLTDVEEELAAVADYNHVQLESMPTSNHQAPPHRLFLVVVELDPLIQRSTSASGHMTCRVHVISDCDIVQQMRDAFHDRPVAELTDICNEAVRLHRLSLRQSEEFRAATKSLVCDAVTTGYNGLPSFEYVGSPCDCYERQHAFSLVASVHRPLELSVEPVQVEKKLFPVPEYCDVCLGDCSSGDTMTSRALALSACSHWFCMSCWQRHLVELIERRTLNLMCPARDCSSPVDVVTLLSILPISYVDRHTANVGEAAIDSDPKNWAWCTNPKCQKIIHRRGPRLTAVDDSETRMATSSIVRCCCGTSSCFECRDMPHWPASCSQSHSYDKMRQQRGDDKRRLPPKTVFVQVKRCPACQYPIEKNGGCPHMTCSRCHKQFCWLCRGDWAHNYSHCRQVPEITIEIDHTADVIMHMQFYQLAIAQRWKRTCWTGNKMTSRLQSRCARVEHCRSFGSSSMASGVRYKKMNKVKDILRYCATNVSNSANFDIIRAAATFYIEARFVIEYSYVHLMSCTKRQADRVKEDQLCLLTLLADRLETLLFEPQSKRTEAKLCTLLTSRLETGVKHLSAVIDSFQRTERRTRSSMQYVDERQIATLV